jgi:Tfp pilus assembly protein PilV
MEVLAATFLLSVGLVSMAALLGGCLKTTRQSKYVSLATALASEKLEDLSRWDSDDQQIYAPSGGTSGSLTSNTSQNVTSSGVTIYVDYYDQIQLSATGGSFSETVSSSSGNYTTTSHQPSGIISVTTSTTAPSAVSFLRRWIIEKDTPVTGVRRITVWVQAQDPAVQPPVTFQMSMVRP